MTEPMPCEKCGQVHARCSSHRRDGEPCTMAPRKGQKVCKMHGGSTPAAVVAGKSRYIEAKIRGQLAERTWEPLTDPIAAYADLAGEEWALKEIFREKVNELRSWTAMNADGAEDVRALLAGYERSLDRTAKRLVDMMRIGIDVQTLKQAKERPSREQAEVFLRVLQAVLDGLSLTPEQRDRVPDMLRDAIAKEGLL